MYLLGFSVVASWVLLAALIPYYFVEARVFRMYRRWTIEQLEQATVYLLGPDEPMLAAETHLWKGIFGIRATRNRAVAVTSSHVLIFGFDSTDGPPRRGWVFEPDPVLAAWRQGLQQPAAAAGPR
jgi:hypothetical protein